MDELALVIEAPSRALTWARRLASPDQRYPPLPAGPQRPGERSTMLPPPGQIEHSLHNLQISDPDLLERAAAIDEATRAITAEARMKASRAEIMPGAATQSVSRAHHRSGHPVPHVLALDARALQAGRCPLYGRS